MGCMEWKTRVLIDASKEIFIFCSRLRLINGSYVVGDRGAELGWRNVAVHGGGEAGNARDIQ